MRLVSAAVLLGTLACTDAFNPRPGAVLDGSWTSAGLSAFPVTLTAGANGVTLSTPCWKAQFASVRLSDSLTFQDTGVVTEAVGLVTLRVGEPYIIIGRVVGHDLAVNQEILTPGSAGFQVCTA